MMLDQIQVVLSHTTHPGNIGAAARAMKVMGLSELVLVRPKHFPSAEATLRASKADDVLANARVCETMEQAIAGSRLIVGASARTRSLPSKLVTPRQLVDQMQQDKERVPVSLLFGTESSGLTNEELHLCHYHVFIPTNPEYSSLNLASAVQILAYEMRLAFSESEPLPKQLPNSNETVVSREKLLGLVEHFEEAMQDTGYLQPELKQQTAIKMNRLLSKADVSLSELNMLRGFLSTVIKKVNTTKSN